MTGTDAINALIALFEREGYARAEPAVLQPADAFIDFSGEDIRRRMFVTQDAAGVELCLRPEYTIPVCLQHLAAEARGSGELQLWRPGFRMRPGEPASSCRRESNRSAGPIRGAADAEILGLALEGLDQLGLTSRPGAPRRYGAAERPDRRA